MLRVIRSLRVSRVVVLLSSRKDCLRRLRLKHSRLFRDGETPTLRKRILGRSRRILSTNALMRMLQEKKRTSQSKRTFKTLALKRWTSEKQSLSVKVSVSKWRLIWLYYRKEEEEGEENQGAGTEEDQGSKRRWELCGGRLRRSNSWPHYGWDRWWRGDPFKILSHFRW